MVEISAALVKTLRERTGAGMMDCKKALNEVNGQLEEAIDWLRKKGLAAAAKKAGRVAAEGLIGFASAGTKASLIEINAETDFVGRNELFQQYVRDAAQKALETNGDLEAIKDAAYPGSDKNFAEQITHLIAVIGENMNLRRSTCLSVTQGVVTGYIHGAVTPGLGRLGVLVALESAADQNALLELGKQIAMHIAANHPQSLTIEALDPEIVARERNVISDQARATGRPEEVVQKMIEGRLRKFYEESVLLEQAFVMDPSKPVKDIIADFSRKHNTPVTLKSFTRYALGEGIEKAESDFAAEVAAQLA